MSDPQNALSPLKEWWQRVVIVRVKAIVYTLGIVIILAGSFQIQNYTLNNDRLKDVADRQVQVCDALIKARKDLREVLFYVVDLRDVPDLLTNRTATTYTLNRVAFINTRYPEFTEKDCQALVVNVSEKELFAKTGKSILDSVAYMLDSCERAAPDCLFLGFDRPPEDHCGLVGWVGNIRVWDGNTMDSGLREGRLMCFNAFAFDVSIRMSRCYIDFDKEGNTLSPAVVESMSNELYYDAHVMYVQWIGLWKAGQVSELDTCEPISVGNMTAYNEGGCAGWEFVVTVGVM